MDVKIRSFNAYRAKRFGYVITPGDALIMMRSALHTHTELQFSSRFDNISFSATLADGANGCRFKDITYSHPEYWDTVIVPMTDAEEDRVYAEAKRIEGQPYDDIGLASFVSRANIITPRPGYWWCTRAVAYLVKLIYPVLPLVPEETHPTWGDTICRWYFSGINHGLTQINTEKKIFTTKDTKITKKNISENQRKSVVKKGNLKCLNG